MKKGLDMNFCRRCGAALAQKQVHVFECANGHVIYANAVPGTGIVLYNDSGEVLVLRRAFDPGKGHLDAPGGFCDGDETAEAAVMREVFEEVGLSPEDYEAPQFVLSDIDRYDYKGEVVSVLGLMFCAKLIGSPHPKAADDAASVELISLRSLDLKEIYFPSVRKAFEVVRQRLDNTAK